MTAPAAVLSEKLARELPREAAAWLDAARAEVASGADDGRLCALISLASRYAPRGPSLWDPADLARAGRALAGWNPERWTWLECARASLLLAHPRLAGPEGVRAVEEAFRYADVGEACALYRSLALLPEPARFAWRAGEGCRSSMRAVFEAAACDTPFPARWFDDIAWRQMAVKCLFVGAPLARVHGLDSRLDPELARMALDLAEERRSAGRPVQPELWALLGPHGGARGLASIERELERGPSLGRRGAALALARAGATSRLAALAERERDPEVRATMRAALEGCHAAPDFAPLHAD